MDRFAIIEIDAGMTVVQLPPGATVEEEAVRQGGLVVDPGPYDNYEDAVDAMESLKIDEEEEDEL